MLWGAATTFLKVSQRMLWKAVVEGRDAAVLKLHELAANSPNELWLIHHPSNTVVFTIDGLLSRNITWYFCPFFQTIE